MQQLWAGEKKREEVKAAATGDGKQLPQGIDKEQQTEKMRKGNRTRKGDRGPGSQSANVSCVSCALQDSIIMQ